MFPNKTCTKSKKKLPLIHLILPLIILHLLRLLLGGRIAARRGERVERVRLTDTSAGASGDAQVLGRAHIIAVLLVASPSSYRQ
jgi:hypothetical protein